VKAINKKKDSFNLGISKSTHHPTTKPPTDVGLDVVERVNLFK